MIRVAGFEIAEDLSDYFAEALLHEWAFFPLAVSDEGYRLAFADDADVDEAVPRIESLTGRRVVAIERGDRRRIVEAIETLKDPRRAAVANCTPEFRFKCPQQWLELAPTADAGVRYCEACGRDVHLCGDQERLVEHARLGHCVAILDERRDGMCTVGFVVIPSDSPPSPPAPRPLGS